MHPVAHPCVNEMLYLSFHHLDELHRPGAFMRDKPPPLGPAIGLIVMPDPGEQGVFTILVQNDAQVLIDPRGPETGRCLDPVQLQPVALGIEHQVYRRHLDLLLLLRSQPVERIGESRGVEEGHNFFNLLAISSSFLCRLWTSSSTSSSSSSCHDWKNCSAFPNLPPCRLSVGSAAAMRMASR